jgi:hypothetical protein
MVAHRSFFSHLQARHPGSLWLRSAALFWGVMLSILTAVVLLKPTSPSLNILWREAGRAWATGIDLYGYHPRHYLGGFRYGPLIAFFLTPLSWMPLGIAAALVRLVNAAFLLIPTWIWLKQAAPGKLDTRSLGVFLILLGLLALPNLEAGQFNLVVLGLLMGGLLAVHRECWKTAAALLAVAAVFKVYPLAFALLLAAVYPRQLLPRLLVACGVVLALPFALNDPAYVWRQYRDWFGLLLQADEHRRYLPLTDGETYRDLLYLFRLWNIQLPLRIYAVMQALIGVLFAGLCLLTVRRGWPRTVVLWNVLVLGTCWLTLCGPASEPRTYGLTAPVVAWWAVWTYRHGPGLARILAAQACGLQVLCVFSSISPHSVLYFRSAGLHPISVLFLLGSWFSAWPAIAANRQAAESRNRSGQARAA